MKPGAPSAKPRAAAQDAVTDGSFAYTHIKNRLIRGGFAQGARVTEQEIAEEIGASRTPVREAMRRLVAEGFFQFKPNVGPFVATWRKAEIVELFDLRVLVESAVAAAAAQRIGDEQVADLEKLQDEIEEGGVDIRVRNLERIGKLNRRFHQVIAEASRSRRLVSMLGNAIEQPVVQKTFSLYSKAELQRSFLHHRELIDALRARDPDWASDSMRCHVRAAKHAYVKALK
jgi:DNA-binding GntR family transcriptional regulator